MLLALSLWALSTGASALSPMESLTALWSDSGDRAAIVVQQVRLPRIIVAIATGAALAVAGAIIQAITGNPLADPGLLGVNAGAAFAVVCGMAFFSITAMAALVWLAFLGAALTAAAVLALGSAGRRGATPLRLILAGVIIASFIAALTAIILVLDAQTMDVVRQWTVGNLKGRALETTLPILPYVAVTITAAFFLAPQITALSLGEEIAQSLGQDQHFWRLTAAGLVVALAGSAVALAGPLSFVGLVVPHMVRLTMGADYGRILPNAALGGAILTLTADTLPRALWARDIPVGVTMALIGAPVFVWLAMRRS